MNLDYITLNLLLQIFSLLTDMVTASYCTPAMQDLHKDALEAGITIVNEVSIYLLLYFWQFPKVVNLGSDTFGNPIFQMVLQN